MGFAVSKYFTVSAVTIIFSFSLRAQVPVQSDAMKRADSLAALKNYTGALPIYMELLKRFPSDPSLQLKTGLAYLHGTRNFDEALRLLQLASAKEVDNSVYFYLAQAHHQNYSFDEAIGFLRRFTINGGSSAITRQQVEQLLNWCENGSFLLKFYFQPGVIDRKRIFHSEILNFAPRVNEGWNFVSLPASLKTQTDIRLKHESIALFPKAPKAGDKVYFSSYGTTATQGKDIFFIERLPDGFWSRPKNMGDPINTPLDEDFPYVTPDGNTLYFASRGHYSMGGFDLYRSVFNSETGQWSAPENLGFPFISPADDLFFVPDTNNKTALIFTNRNTPSDSLDVVLIELDFNPIRKAVTALDPIRNIAQLEPLKPEPQARTTGSAPVTQSKTARFSAVENDPEYSRVLAQGFLEQMKTDSLRGQLEKLRARFDFITTAEERRRLEAQVVKVEDAMLAAQQNADRAFARASEIEQEYLTGKRAPNKNITENFALDNPKYLYQAQFAPTVFHTEELKRLANAERNADALNQTKRELLDLRRRILEMEQQQSYEQNLNYRNAYKNYVSRVKGFNPQFSDYINLKKKLYSDCVSVAMVKQGASNRPEIRSEIDKANAHFRSAISIRNNLTPETADESNFEALLLDDLGVLRLELVFSRLWGLKLFEQSVLSSIIRLEQTLFGAATTQPLEPGKPNNQVAVTGSGDQPKITRQETDKRVEPVNLKPEVSAEFAILDKSPYGPDNPVAVDEPFPSGVIYKIQLGAFSNPVNLQMFKGITPLSAERVSGGKITKYYAGKFTSLTSAENALSQIKSIGFKDAFIVAWHNGRSVAPSRAQTLEGLPAESPSKPKTEVQMQGAPVNYMILLGSYKGRLPDNVTQTVRALAPGKDIVRKPDGQGGFTFSIGSFRSIDEANRVKDNMVASGIGGAKVVAVETE